MDRVGRVLLFAEPETCPEIPYPQRTAQPDEAQLSKAEHVTPWSARTSYELTGWVAR